MTIDWDDIGKLKDYENAEEIKAAIEACYFKDNAVNDAKAVDDFLNKMNIGDTIIVKKGKNTLLGCDKFLSDYYDDKKKSFKPNKIIDKKIVIKLKKYLLYLSNIDTINIKLIN